MVSDPERGPEAESRGSRTRVEGSFGYQMCRNRFWLLRTLFVFGFAVNFEIPQQTTP